MRNHHKKSIRSLNANTRTQRSETTAQKGTVITTSWKNLPAAYLDAGNRHRTQRQTSRISDRAPAERITETGKPQTKNSKRPGFGYLYIDRIGKRKAGRRNDLGPVEILRAEGHRNKVYALRQRRDPQTSDKIGGRDADRQKSQTGDPPRRVIAEIDNRNSANIELLERKPTRRIVKRIQSGGRHSEGQCQRLGRCIDCRLRRGKIEIHGCRLTCTDQQGAGGGCPEHHCKECRGDPFTCLDQHSLFPQKRHDADKRHLSRYLPCFSATRLI